jgi:hypothetical protein
VPDFGDPATLRVRFDLSEVRVLQQDENALHERTRADLLAGLLTLNQALEAVGEDPLSGPEGDVRYVPGTITVTPMDRLIPPEPQEPPADEEPERPASLPAADEQRALAAAGARNGHAKAPAGIALPLTDADLDRLSNVGPSDAEAAERFWRQHVDGPLDGLLDARPEDDEA